MSDLAFANVSALQIIPVSEALAVLGLDVAELMRRAGLPPPGLLARDARVSVVAELAFWEAAVALSGDPAIGLRVADVLEQGALGTFGYLLRNSATLAELLERARRYGRLLDDLTRVELQVRDDVATVRIGRIGDYPVPAAGAEFLIALVLARLACNWPNLRPLSVGFAHARGAPQQLYERRFGCPVRFAAGANQISCEAALLNQPAPAVDPALGRVLEEHTARLLSELPASDSLSARARAALGALLEQGQAQPANLARALRTSERTLRRKLQAEGTSYQNLLDQLRRSLALSRVAHGQEGLGQLATRLGFADTSAFYRAFKRWTGTTPARYRDGRARL
jgi:AraC-like DNA-binding protein